MITFNHSKVLILSSEALTFKFYAAGDLEAITPLTNI